MNLHHQGRRLPEIGCGWICGQGKPCPYEEEDNAERSGTGFGKISLGQCSRGLGMRPSVKWTKNGAAHIVTSFAAHFAVVVFLAARLFWRFR